MSKILKYTPEELSFLDKVKAAVQQIERSPEIDDVLFLRNDFLQIAKFYLKGHGVRHGSDNRH
jgi:hypothetical protein